MPREMTRLQDERLDLDGDISASSIMGILYVLQDSTHLDEESGAIKLSPRAQFELLEWLYQRRYPLYRATHLTLGDDEMPAWIKSGRAGNVTVVVDAEDAQGPRK